MATTPAKLPNIPPALRELLDSQQRRLAGLRDKRSVALMQKVLNQARRELRQRLATMGGLEARYTGYQHRIMLAQVETAMRELSHRGGQALSQAVQLATDQSIQDTFQRIAAASQEFNLANVGMPVKEIARLVKGDSKLRDVEAERIEKGARKWGMDGVARMESELAQSLAQGESVSAATRRITGSDVWVERSWQAERLVRTEFSYAYNAGSRKALDKVAKTDSELWLCWYEFARGPEWAGPTNAPWPGPATPLDLRVGEDSLRLHGQLRRPGQAFIDPETGERFAHPPNRPNDRSTLLIVRAPKTKAT